MYKKIIKAGLILSTALIFTACEKKVTTEVHEVHWDRDMCARCVMVVSDRNQTVQVINPKDGEAYIFDDIGGPWGPRARARAQKKRPGPSVRALFLGQGPGPWALGPQWYEFP